MEKIYSRKNRNTCRIAKSSPETVQFLMNFSKSLDVINYKEMQFENTLN